MTDPVRQKDWDADADRYQQQHPLTTVSKGIKNPYTLLETVRRAGCCSIIMIGHRGGTTNAGIVMTGSDPLIPNDAFAEWLKNTMKSNDCESCNVRVFACQLSGDPGSCEKYGANQQEQAIKEATNFNHFAVLSECTVFATKALISIGQNHTCNPKDKTGERDLPLMDPYPPK